MLKIVIYGAESTGKTSLSQSLAASYNTVWVPEFARDFLQEKYNNCGEVCAYEDLMPIAKGQIALEEKAKSKVKNDLLFCDTNPLQTYYYGKAYYPNFKHPELWELAQSRTYDHYFLTYIDTPWEEDDLRDRPEQREEMHHLFEKSLQDNHLPYTLLKGNPEERLQKAKSVLQRLLED